jgi:hypothetical protein
VQAAASAIDQGRAMGVLDRLAGAGTSPRSAA